MAGVIFERGLRPIYVSPMLFCLTRTKSFRDPWVSHPANTLVLADVFGFHRCGAAVPGRLRLALNGWNRPYPFLPITW